MKVNIVATIPNVTHALEKIIQERAVNSAIIHDFDKAIYVEIFSETQNSVCVVTDEYRDTLSSIYKDTANEEDYFIPFFLYAVKENGEQWDYLDQILEENREQLASTAEDLGELHEMLDRNTIKVEKS